LHLRVESVPDSYALALILPLSVGAYNPEHLKRLKQTKKCVVCDLRDANLLGTHLKGADLRGPSCRKPI
jgi:hypothetical protein